uniref:ATP synthase F0 subunit 8 n=1 Tax=Atergatis floridus TaxID=373434 RepID=A0A343UMB2_9EUCA|nr:ATP synthase F0 subunit 8 [Atergatis floridus]AVE15412.1 ATP synthase F0 subunit 8 [Atergatis floridus]
MPQMAPLLWLYLYFFFLMSLMLILVLNFFIKPFEIMSSLSSSQYTTQKPWKL